jgi:hypothetical protein
MSIEKNRQRVAGAVRQGLAKGGLDLAGLPADKQEMLVGAVSDSVLTSVNEMLDDITKTPAEELQMAGDEHVLWQGRPFLSIDERYVITTQRVKIIKGVLARKVENYELIRVQDIDYKQGLGERIAGIGDIFIRGHDPSSPEIVLKNVPQPEAVYEVLRKAWLAARKTYGLQFRDIV